MFIIKPKKAGSLPLGQWIKMHLAYLFIGNNIDSYEHRDKSGLLEKHSTKKMGLFRQALLTTFPPVGYDPTTQQITDSQGKVRAYDGTQSFGLLILTSFFGVPNRPTFQPDGSLKLTASQVLIGGWDSERFVASLLKSPFVFLINLALLFPNIFINVAKILTNLLPTFTTYVLARACRTVVRGMKYKRGTEYLAAIAPLMILGPLHATFKLISLICKALTSPLTSAKMARAYCREVSGTILGIEVGTLLGIIGILISLTLTATVLAIGLPLAISTASLLFPTATTAALHFFIGLSQVPLIATFLSVIHGALASGVAILGVTIGPIVMTLAKFIGLTVSAEALAVGTVLGVVVAVVVTFSSWVAEQIGTAWVCWKKSNTVSNPLTAKSESHHYQRLDSTLKGSKERSTKSPYSAPGSKESFSSSESKSLLRQGDKKPQTASAQPEDKHKLVVESANARSAVTRAASSVDSHSAHRYNALQDDDIAMDTMEEHWATTIFSGKATGPDQRKYSTWYSSELLPILMQANLPISRTKKPIIYFAPQTGYGGVRISYEKHIECFVHYLKLQRNCGIMLSVEPGAGENHFVVSIGTPEGELFYINPTTSKHVDALTCFTQLKKDQIIKSVAVYESPKPLQHDIGKSIVSCGPIGVELVRFFATVENLIGVLRSASQQNGGVSFDLLDILKHSHLKELALADEEIYEVLITQIRETHYQLLTTLTLKEVQSFAEQEDVKLGLLDPIIHSTKLSASSKEADDEFDLYAAEVEELDDDDMVHDDELSSSGEHANTHN